MKKLVILGGSGIGRIAASIASLTGVYMPLGFLNDSLAKGELVGKYKPLPVIGKTEDLPKLLKMKDVSVFIAYVGLGNEKDTFEKILNLDIPPERMANLIHPLAYIPKGVCKIGKGVLFGPYSQISPDVTIGDNCILLSNSFVGHDSVLARFAHLAAGAVVGANVYVGKAVHVGTNSVIREKTHIGDYSLIGCGATVVKNVDENSVVAGNPAKVLRCKD
jgi:acetyltransferase EpsM